MTTPEIKLRNPACRAAILSPNGRIRCQDASGQEHPHVAYRMWNGTRVRIEW